jgi:hypothetical protein
MGPLIHAALVLWSAVRDFGHHTVDLIRRRRRPS